MFIKIKVKTNSGEQKVEKISDDLFFEKGFEGLYFVKLKDPPEGGRANLELVRVLAKHFGKDVKIKSGFTSKLKIVEVME